jgi:four helix bundle protein
MTNKFQSPNTKQPKHVYNLEDRTYQFARDVRLFLKNLPSTLNNLEDGKQLIRSSGSIGANYIEANESLSKKDFIMRIKISRKEAKESIYWLSILSEKNSDIELDNCKQLIDEAIELKKILSAIIEKSK